MRIVEVLCEFPVDVLPVSRYGRGFRVRRSPEWDRSIHCHVVQGSLCFLQRGPLLPPTSISHFMQGNFFENSDRSKCISEMMAMRRTISGNVSHRRSWRSLSRSGNSRGSRDRVGCFLGSSIKVLLISETVRRHFELNVRKVENTLTNWNSLMSGPS